MIRQAAIGAMDHQRTDDGGDTPSPPLTPEQVATYLRDGVLVVPGALSPSDLDGARRGLARTLLDGYGVDVHDLGGTAGGLVGASSTNGAGASRSSFAFSSCFLLPPRVRSV